MREAFEANDAWFLICLPPGFLHAGDLGLWRICVVLPQTIQKFRVGWTVRDYEPVSHHILFARIDLEATHLRRCVVEIRIVGMNPQRLGCAEVRRMIQHSDAYQLTIDRSTDVAPTPTSSIPIVTSLPFRSQETNFRLVFPFPISTHSHATVAILLE